MKAIKLKNILIILILVLFTACSSSDEGGNQVGGPEPVVVRSLNVNTNEIYQTISGFGAANQMWGTQFPNNSDIQKAYGMGENELGLSIFRIRVASNPDEWPLIVNVTKTAQDLGAKILASPWSPPPSFKTNNSDIGGRLEAEYYAAFAEHLNDFIAFMANNNITIDAISIQNEPDIQVSYESCDWSPTEMRDFLTNHGATINAPIAAPESFNFNQSFSDAILNDDEAAATVDIIAGHIYGGGLAPYPLAEQQGKEIWMTEFLMNQNATANWSNLSSGVIWDETLDMLETLHLSMEYNWNAYIWWYLKRYYSFIGDGDQGTTSGVILKRGYAFSHFSKFVRPGYQRVAVDIPFSGDVVGTAYIGNNETIIVLINSGTGSSGDLNISVNGNTPALATSYVTTITNNRQETSLSSSNDQLIINLPSQSVTTIVIPD